MGTPPKLIKGKIVVGTTMPVGKMVAIDPNDIKEYYRSGYFGCLIKLKDDSWNIYDCVDCEIEDLIKEWTEGNGPAPEDAPEASP